MSIEHIMIGFFGLKIADHARYKSYLKVLATSIIRDLSKTKYNNG